jgi:hypothetical protein
VISECNSQIKARIEGNPNDYYEAVVAARNARRDLAALKLQRLIGHDYQGPVKSVAQAVFRQGPALQQGEKAITYGFPLRGLLATNGNLTVGYVSALRGLRDDVNYIQITTPVQAGNSGGPLLDGSGHLIGVVVAKLNVLKIMQATGDVPQNVNFAVELGVLKGFLEQNKVQTEEAQSTSELPLTDIARAVKLSTYVIECETKVVPRPAPSASAPAPNAPNHGGVSIPPAPQGLTAVSVAWLKLSDIRRPYSGSPEIF